MRLASSLLLATAMGCTEGVDPNAPVPTPQDEMGTYSCFENIDGDCVTWPKGTTIPVTMARSEGADTPQEEFEDLFRMAIAQWNASAEEIGMDVRFGEPTYSTISCTEAVQEEETNAARDIFASGVLACVPSYAQWDEYYSEGGDVRVDGTEQEPENIDPVILNSDVRPRPDGPLGAAQLGFSPFYDSIVNVTVFISPYSSDYFGISENISPDPTEAQLIGIYNHELGHALGLVHSEKEDALMWPYVHQADQPTHYEIEGLKAMYGTEN